MKTFSQSSYRWKNKTFLVGHIKKAGHGETLKRVARTGPKTGIFDNTNAQFRYLDGSCLFKNDRMTRIEADTHRFEILLGHFADE
jgi:hypothetical protein